MLNEIFSLVFKYRECCSAMKVKEKMPINDGITVQIQRHSKGIGVVFHEIIIALCVCFSRPTKKGQKA